jgi:hypothetical protein
MENENLNTEETANSDLGAVSGSLSDFDMLDEDKGDGSYCCGKRMVLAASGIVYECLKCGGWEYSSS